MKQQIDTKHTRIDEWSTIPETIYIYDDIEQWHE